MNWARNSLLVCTPHSAPQSSGSYPSLPYPWFLGPGDGFGMGCGAQRLIFEFCFDGFWSHGVVSGWALGWFGDGFCGPGEVALAASHWWEACGKSICKHTKHAGPAAALQGPKKERLGIPEFALADCCWCLFWHFASLPAILCCGCRQRKDHKGKAMYIITSCAAFYSNLMPVRVSSGPAGNQDILHFDWGHVLKPQVLKVCIFGA